MSTEGDVLRGLARTVAPLLAVIPAAGPIVAPIAQAALELAADLAESGADVVVEIQRIRRSHELLADVRREWNDNIADRFTGELLPPPSDPYGDEP